MDASPLLNIDRLPSRSTFRGFTGSPCGIIGTLMFLLITGIINYSLVISYSQGLYFQSSYQTQASPYSILQCPSDVRMALVFFNKTSGAVANHTYLTTLFDTKIFNTNPLGSNVYLQNSLLCNGSNSKYFSDAVNPVILPDCFIFTPNRSFIYSYVASLSTTLQYSTVGFLIGLSCLNPFYCKSGGSTLASVQGNLTSAFTNFSAVLYFSTKVLQPDGSSRHQVYNVSSLFFTNPSTIGASFDVQIMMNNVTMDYSIMPWTNTINKMNLVYLGLSKATPKTTTSIYSPLPKIDLIATNYQYLTFRYYKKEDWILGIIGGSAFLVFLGLWIFCHPFNQGLWRIQAAEQLLIQVNPVHNDHATTLELFKRATIPFSYIFIRFNPFKRNKAIATFTSLMDITKVIKQGKIAYRNIKHFVGKNMYKKIKMLDFQNNRIPNRLKQRAQEPRERPNTSFQNIQGFQQFKQQPPLQNRGQKHKNHDESNHELLEKEGQKHRQLQDIRENIQQENIKKATNFQFLNIENQQENKDNEEIKKQQLTKKQNTQSMNGQQNFQFFDQNDKIKIKKQRIKKQQSVKNIKEQHLKKQIIPIESLEQLHKQQDQQRNRVTINEKNHDSVLEAQINGTKKEEKEKSSDDNVLSKSNSQQKKNEVIDERNNQENTSSIIPVNQNQVVLQNTQQIYKLQAQLLSMTPQVLAACKNSENSKQMLENFPTIMHLNNCIEPFNYVYQVQSYKSDDKPLKEISKFQKFLSCLTQFLELFDFYKVKIQFTAFSVNYSWVGVFFTFLILVLPFLQVGNMIQSSGKYQTFVSQDVQKSIKINYSLKIGYGFRPAVCFNQNSAFYITGSGQTVQIQFYTYSASKGYTYYSPVQLGTNQETLLGITPDSQYGNLDTSTCFIFPDNTPVPMGGFNTPQEAYFGFRISGYCSGTTSYCNSVQSTTNTNLLNFLNSGSNTFAFYTPINQYNPNTNKVLSGNVYAHTLREGVSSFNTAMAVQQTLYVDRIQLLDSYGERFIGKAPPLIEEGICTSRYQLGELTKVINTSNPYYELKVRPSGYTTKVFLVGNTTDIIIGTLGGVLFLCYIAFHKFGKVYNNFNIRLKLAKQIYKEQAYDQWSAPFKFMYLFATRLLSVIYCCNASTRAQIARMQKVDNKIINDLNAIQLCKTVYTCSKLSTIRFKTLAEKEIAMVYFKEKSDLQVQEQKSQKPITQFYDEDSNDSQDNATSNKVANETNIKISRQTSKAKMSELNHGQLDGSEEIDYVMPQDAYKEKANLKKANQRQWLAMFDSFHVDAEFSLNGKWRIGSVFGCFMSILSIGIIFALFLYYIIYFDQGFNKRISYDRGVNLDPMNIIPIQLNTTSDFRAAFGFYNKPNFAFQNVSNFLNSSANSTVSISLYQVVQTWVNSTVVITETKYDLVPCPSNYFNGYFSDNQDPSYFSSVSNGFCLPTKLLLNLTSNYQYNSQFFKISVYNKTVNGSTPLQSLTSSFSLGIYMTIPVINLDSQTFTYQVHQIRPNSEILSRAYNVNVTLTKKTYTFNTPNSTLGQNNNTITTYNYIESRAYEITNANTPTTAPRLYNITFSHSGLMETYNVTYSSITELLGYAGGITLIVIFVLGCIAQSFNTYYKEYLIAKELYIHWPTTNDPKDNNKNTLERDEDVPLMNNKELERVERLNELSQFQVWKTWLLSFPANLSRSYNWNENLSNIELFRRRLRYDLDLFQFYKKIDKIRDTINMNQQFRLKSNPSVPLTSIYDKAIVIETAIFQYSHSERMYSNVIAHQLSSRDQWRLHIAEQEGVKIENVFDNQYLQNVLIYKPEGMVFEERHEEMVNVGLSEQRQRRHNMDCNQAQVQYIQRPPRTVEGLQKPQQYEPSPQYQEHYNNNQSQEGNSQNIQDNPDDSFSED